MNDKDTVVVPRAVIERVIRLADTLASDVPITSAARKHITDAYAALAAAPSTSVREEVEDLKQSVIAFCAPWAVTYARDLGLPSGHLHPEHYDILARCGGRMDDFTRAGLTPTDLPPLQDTGERDG